MARIEVTYTLCFARGIKLSCEVPFVKFQWLVLKLPADNQRMSNSGFFVSSYILVLRYIQFVFFQGVHSGDEGISSEASNSPQPPLQLPPAQNHVAALQQNMNGNQHVINNNRFHHYHKIGALLD